MFALVEGNGTEVTIKTQPTVGLSRRRREDIGLLGVDLETVTRHRRILEGVPEPFGNAHRLSGWILYLGADQLLGKASSSGRLVERDSSTAVGRSEVSISSVFEPTFRE